jgi:UDP:flavonoid glycosyltransferase YjiC (YdhE family)
MPDLQENTAISAEPGVSLKKRRIVLTTFGSLGDLHPYIALALGLQARGHEVVIATSGAYRQKVEALGIGFRAVQPDHPDPETGADLMRRSMDRRTGSEFVIREYMMSVLRETYEDTVAAADGADILVSHLLTFTTRLVAEKKGIPWASTFLQPLGLLSVYDPPVFPQIPMLAKLRFLGPAFHRLLFWCGKWSARSWFKPWHRLRADIGLPPTSEIPLFEGNSPLLVLALFSKFLADKQPDWPQQTVITGFPFYDGGDRLPAELASFLGEGSPPIVFTLGSSGVEIAGPFYEHSVTAAKRLGRRAVIIVGKNARQYQASLPDGVIASDYAPFSVLFPRAAVIVHAGGIGTTAQAMRSGRPMLVVPYAHDQPDNAERVKRLGIARTIPRHHYTPARAAAELGHLLDNPACSQRAAEIGAEIRQEDGVRLACDSLEGLLHVARPAEVVAE